MLTQFSHSSYPLGPLSEVGDLSSSFINSSTINISWSPPFTLPGTGITGYNISITGNGTTTNYFTSDSYYVLHLSDITDSRCDKINITVSGYNGLDGEDETIYAQSGDVNVFYFTAFSFSYNLILYTIIIPILHIHDQSN